MVDPNDPDNDAKLPGYRIALEGLKFGGRERLDNESVAQLFKLFKQEGVKTPLDAQKVLAMVEARAANTAENNPASYLKALLGVSLGQKPGQLPQLMGLLSAAGINTDSAWKARERVDALNQASVGSSAKMAATGELAMRQGFISPETVAYNMPDSTKEAGFSREEAGLDEKDRRGVVSIRRKREDIQCVMAELPAGKD